MAETLILAGKNITFVFLLSYRTSFTYNFTIFVPYHSSLSFNILFFFSRPLTCIIYQTTGHQNCCGTHDLWIFITTGHGSLAQTNGLYYSCEKNPYHRCQLSSGTFYAWLTWSRYFPDKQNLSSTQEFYLF